MAKLLTKYFGEVDLEKPNDWYETEVLLDDKSIELSLAFSSVANNVEADLFQRIEDYIGDLKSNEKVMRGLMRQNFDEDGEAKKYVENQISEQEAEDLAALLEGVSKKIGKKERLLSVLSLLRIVFYPESEDPIFAVLDYTLDEDLTDELLAAKLHKDGKVEFDLES